MNELLQLNLTDSKIDFVLPIGATEIILSHVVFDRDVSVFPLWLAVEFDSIRPKVKGTSRTDTNWNKLQITHKPSNTYTFEDKKYKIPKHERLLCSVVTCFEAGSDTLRYKPFPCNATLYYSIR